MPGSTFSFVRDGDETFAFRLINKLKLFKLAVSLAGSESLVQRPASIAHSRVRLIEVELPALTMDW